jgi:hypothetical protein
MMKRILTFLLLAISTLIAGCILIPFPHEQWLSPKFCGRVTDAETGAPLQSVTVTLSVWQFKKKTIQDVVTHTDAAGYYSIIATQHSNWVGMMLGPADPALDVARVSFECDGYVSTFQERQWIVRGHHKFGVDVELRRNSPNQPPLRMPVSGTPAAGAPVAPPPGIVGR